VSPREASKLSLQASLSCLGVSACSSVVGVMVLLPHRDMSWRDAIVLAMMALLAWWWFANYPVRRDLVVAFVIVSCSPGGIVVTVWEQIATPRSSVAFASRGAGGLDPGK
jgi:hypothetical protein